MRAHFWLKMKGHLKREASATRVKAPQFKRRQPQVILDTALMRGRSLFWCIHPIKISFASFFLSCPTPLPPDSRVKCRPCMYVYYYYYYYFPLSLFHFIISLIIYIFFFYYFLFCVFYIFFCIYVCRERERFFFSLNIVMLGIKMRVLATPT